MRSLKLNKERILKKFVAAILIAASTQTGAQQNVPEIPFNSCRIS